MRWALKDEEASDGWGGSGRILPARSSTMSRPRRDDNFSCPAIWEEIFSASQSSFILPLWSSSFSMPDRLFSSSRPPLPWPLREHASSKSLDPYGKWALLPFVPPSWLRSESPAVLRCPQTCLLQASGSVSFPASLINLHFFLGANHGHLYLLFS